MLKGHVLRRALLRPAYLAARLVWFATRPRHVGAVVALWRDGRVLLVYQSYRRRWTLPGGGVGRGEPPEDAVRREAEEELGLVLPPGTLRAALQVDDDWEHRRETVHVFEAPLPGAPLLDGVELVDHALLTPAEALAREPPPHVRAYLLSRQGPSG